MNKKRNLVHMYQFGVYTPPLRKVMTDDRAWELKGVLYPYRGNLKFNYRWLDEFQPKKR